MGVVVSDFVEELACVVENCVCAGQLVWGHESQGNYEAVVEGGFVLLGDFFETFYGYYLLYCLLEIVAVYHQTISPNLINLIILYIPLQSIKSIPTP